MSWVSVTGTTILFVVCVTCSPIDVHKPATGARTELLPPDIDSGPMLTTDLMPPPVSIEMPEKNLSDTHLVPAPLLEERIRVDSMNENNAIKQIIAVANAEKKVHEAAGQPALDYSLKLVKIRRKRHLKYKKSYGGGCGGGCGYYQPQPVYYKVVVVPVVVQKKQYYHPQPTCNVCGRGGGGYGGYGGSYSYAQASAQSYSYGK